jgi:hypothetical protein
VSVVYIADNGAEVCFPIFAIFLTECATAACCWMQEWTPMCYQHAQLAPRAWCNPRSAAPAGYILPLTPKAYNLQNRHPPKRKFYGSYIAKSGFQTHFIAIFIVLRASEAAAGITHADSKRPGVLVCIADSGSEVCFPVFAIFLTVFAYAAIVGGRCFSDWVPTAGCRLRILSATWVDRATSTDGTPLHDGHEKQKRSLASHCCKP